MNEYIAFLAECGDNDLDFTKKGVSTHFIIVALIVRKDKLSEAEAQLEVIRQHFFQQGCIESAKISDNDEVRALILSQLVIDPFHILALVVDKRQLRGEGFYHKDSFYKCLPSAYIA